MKQHPSAISLVGFKTKEEVQSYIDHIPHARFELSYKMNQAFLDELEPIIQGRVVSAHAACPNQPIFPNFASHDPDVLEQSLEAVKRTLETCTRFGATTMVLHPGYVTDLGIPSENHARQALLDDPSFLPYIGVADGAICRTDYPESEGYQRHSRQAMKQLAFVAELGTQYGVTVAVENLNPRVAYLFQKPEEMVALAENHTLCLDIGHLFIASGVYGFDYLLAIEQILATGKVVTSHLHTNSTDPAQRRYRDDHHNLDQNTLPIHQSLCLLNQANVQLVLETVADPVHNTRVLNALIEECHAPH